MKNNIPVIVLRSNDNCFLDILRACASAGIKTIPVIFTWEGAAPWNSEASCFFKDAFTIANPASDEEQAKNDMIQIGKMMFQKYGQKLLVISSSDTNLFFMQKYFADFSPYFLQMGHGNFDENCIRELRKDSSAQLLLKGGVDIPLTYPVIKEEQIEYAVEHITYPCVYKPVYKDLTSSFQNTHNKKKAIECSTSEELRELLYKEVKNGFELIVQEKIDFDSLEDEVSCYVYSNQHGEIIAISGQHKIMEHPHPYGTGVVSCPYMDSEFLEIAKKIVNAYQWRGFLGIEFMRNRKNNKWVVIEINLRPWISVNFQAMIGYNYIKYLYEDFYDIKRETCNIMQEGSMSIYRVNLTLLLQKEVSEQKDVSKALSNIKTFLQKHMGKIIFSYYIKEDSVPGEIEKNNFMLMYPDKESEIKEIFELVVENNKVFSC